MSRPEAVTRAILEGRRPGHTPGWLIAGLVVAGVCLLFAAVYLLLVTVFVGVLLFLLALPTTVLFLGLVMYVDRIEPEPKLLLLFFLLWGMGTSIVFALILNTLAGVLLFVPTFGMEVGGQLTASISAPVVEEGLKGLPLLFLFIRRRHELNGFTDAVVYAACVGLGFALMENVQYYFVGLISGGLQMGGFDFVGALTGLGLVIAVRGILSPLCHPLFTLMTALGFLYAANRRGGARFLVVAAGWLGSMLLHSLWNTGSVLGNLLGLTDAYLLSQLPVYVLFMGLLAAVVVLLVKDRRRVIALIDQYLPQYAGTGAVTESDVRMLGSLKGRKQAREYIASRYGPHARRAMVDYQQVATELALLHEKAAKGGVTQPQFQQRQADLVTALKVTYNSAMGGANVGPAPWQLHPPVPPPAIPPPGHPPALPQQQPYFPPQGPPPPGPR